MSELHNVSCCWNWEKKPSSDCDLLFLAFNSTFLHIWTALRSDWKYLRLNLTRIYKQANNVTIWWFIWFFPVNKKKVILLFLFLFLKCCGRRKVVKQHWFGVVPKKKNEEKNIYSSKSSVIMVRQESRHNMCGVQTRW